MTRPPCYNRPPADEGRWVRNGYRPSDLKPRCRWSPRWYVDRCATWDGTGIGPNGEPYPVANGWNCDGCRWDPRPKAIPHEISRGDKVLVSGMALCVSRRFMGID